MSSAMNAVERVKAKWAEMRKVGEPNEHAMASAAMEASGHADMLAALQQVEAEMRAGFGSSFGETREQVRRAIAKAQSAVCQHIFHTPTGRNYRVCATCGESAPPTETQAMTTQPIKAVALVDGEAGLSLGHLFSEDRRIEWQDELDALSEKLRSNGARHNLRLINVTIVPDSA